MRAPTSDRDGASPCKEEHESKKLLCLWSHGRWGGLRCLHAQQSIVEASVSSIVNCVSKGKERQQCSADTRAGIVMLRPTGEAPCLLGRNWGYDDQGVWVSEGCGGDFGTGSTHRADAPAATAAAAALIESEDEKSAIETATTGTNPTRTTREPSSLTGVFATSSQFQPTDQRKYKTTPAASELISQRLDPLR